MNSDDWQRFAEDLKLHLSRPVAFEPDPDPEGLHVLRINGVDYFFNADGSGYDGYGRPVNLPENPPRSS